MKIYTGQGDEGETGLYGGKRVSKDSLIIEAIGALDELNASVGVCRIYAKKNKDLEDWLERIQYWIFEVGAEICTPKENPSFKKSVSVDQIKELECSMDDQESSLPSLKNFILPGGSDLAAYLHLARTICRRAERRILQLCKKENVRPEILIFLNRLSDWLFIFARVANIRFEEEDILWITHKS